MRRDFHENSLLFLKKTKTLSSLRRGLEYKGLEESWHSCFRGAVAPQAINTFAEPNPESPCALYMVGTRGHSPDGMHHVGVFSLTSSKKADRLNIK